MIPSLTPPRPILYILLAEDWVLAVGEDPLLTMRAGLDHIDQRAHDVEDPWSDEAIRETLTNLTLISVSGIVTCGLSDAELRQRVARILGLPIMARVA